MSDVTAGTEIRDNLRESEALYHMLFSNSLDAVFLTAPDGRILNANLAACQMFGRTVEEICKMGRSGIIDTSDPRLSVALEERNRTGKFFGELIGLKKDGSKFPIELASTIFRDKDNNVHTSVIIRDITERKRTEKAQKESEDRFRALFTQMSEGFALHEVVYDSAHNAIDYRIIDINPAFEKQVGIKAEKAKGELATQLYGVYPAPFIDIYARVAEKGEPQIFQSYFPPLDRYFDISVFSPNPGCFATVFTDITERKRAEAALKTSEARLHELNATKDKFFSIIAHDLKSPFNTIIGFTSILSEQVKVKDYESIEEYAEIIHNSSQRAMDLLTNLLEWSRSQTGRMTFNPEYVDLIVLIKETADLLRDSAQQKSISFTLALPQNLFGMVDRDMIKSILRNLLSNAIKFTHPCGSIVVSAEQQQNELMVVVKDNGMGIEKNNLEKLFRIEETHSTSGTRNERGTGLGLLLSKEFIDKHGGKIWVESEPDKGSVFYFTIPRV